MTDFKIPAPAKYYNLRQAPVILPSLKSDQKDMPNRRLPMDHAKELQKEKEVLRKYFNKGRQELDETSWRSPSQQNLLNAVPSQQSMLGSLSQSPSKLTLGQISQTPTAKMLMEKRIAAFSPELNFQNKGVDDNILQAVNRIKDYQKHRGRLEQIQRRGKDSVNSMRNSTEQQIHQKFRNSRKQATTFRDKAREADIERENKMLLEKIIKQTYQRQPQNTISTGPDNIIGHMMSSRPTFNMTPNHLHGLSIDNMLSPQRVLQKDILTFSKSPIPAPIQRQKRPHHLVPQNMPQTGKSMNFITMKKEALRIDHENRKLMNRLINSKGTVSFQQYQKSYKDMHSNTPANSQSNDQRQTKAKSIMTVIRRKQNRMDSVSSSFLQLPNLPHSAMPDSVGLSDASNLLHEQNLFAPSCYNADSRVQILSNMSSREDLSQNTNNTPLGRIASHSTLTKSQSKNGLSGSNVKNRLPNQLYARSNDISPTISESNSVKILPQPQMMPYGPISKKQRNVPDQQSALLEHGLPRQLSSNQNKSNQKSPTLLQIDHIQSSPDQHASSSGMLSIVNEQIAEQNVYTHYGKNLQLLQTPNQKEQSGPLQTEGSEAFLVKDQSINKISLVQCETFGSGTVTGQSSSKAFFDERGGHQVEEPNNV